MSEDDDFEDLESRVATLESQQSVFHTGRGCAYLAIPWSVGTAIAVAISWPENHSIAWATLHGFLSWIYLAHRFFPK